MKNLLKGLLILLLIVFVGSKGIEWYLEHKFEALINNNPNRTYNINYTSFDLHTLFTGITLNEVSIVPFNKPKGTIINGQVDYAELSGFKWRKFIFSKTLSVDVLSFEQPKFNINVVKDTIKQSDSIPKKRNNKMQNLFSDLLSRVDLNDFQINNGSVIIEQGDSLRIGQLDRIDIRATDIETDSIMFKHIIPFKLGNLEVELDSAFYQINDHTQARVGSISYNIAKETFSINGFSLNYDKNWVAISQMKGLQDDIMEFQLDHLSLNQMNFSSSFWTDLDIEAQSLAIDGLTMSMMRNKNLPRPPDVKKPLFQGMVKKIPIKIDLDSITIRNTKILYGELSVNKHHTGVIEINDINGAITQLSTFPEQQELFKEFHIKLNARLNNAADMRIAIDVPYHNDTFALHTTLGPMDMTALSKSLIPLLGVEIKEGQLKRLDYRMNASFYQSRNSLVMDYENLHLTVFNEKEDGSQKKDGILSSIANAAIRHHNLPEEKHYLKASYTTDRNIYRSPFQHIVAGVLDGTQQIVPSRGIQSLLGSGKKKKKKNKKKTRP